MQPEAKMSSGQTTFDLKAAREAMTRATSPGGQVMMTEEELQEALKWRKTDKLIDGMLSHIDEQAKQIATLKAALVQERANKLSCDGKAFHDYTIDAAAQLAKEYPDIDWGGQL